MRQLIYLKIHGLQRSLNLTKNINPLKMNISVKIHETAVGDDTIVTQEFKKPEIDYPSGQTWPAGK